MIIQRRNFLIGLTSALAAPAIVRVQNIMPVKVFEIRNYSIIHIRPEWMNTIFDEITGIQNFK